MNRYRINLYREREGAERRVRRRLVGATVLGVVIGIEILLVGLLFISGNLLRERADALEANLAAIRQEAAKPQTGPSVELARTIVDYRASRIDWTQIIQGVSESIPDDVTLLRISGGLTLDDGSQPGLDLEGRAGNVEALGPVFQFVDSLRVNGRLAGVLPLVDLETVESERTGIFRVICRRPAPKPAGEEAS